MDKSIGKSPLTPLCQRGVTLPLFYYSFPPLNFDIWHFVFFQKPFFLTVDAAAVLLAVQSHGLRDFQPLSPSLPKIFIIERDPNLSGDSFPSLLDQIMVLVGALEESRRKPIAMSLFGLPGRGFKTDGVTVLASFLSTVGYLF